VSSLEGSKSANDKRQAAGHRQCHGKRWVQQGRQGYRPQEVVFGRRDDENLRHLCKEAVVLNVRSVAGSEFGALSRGKEIYFPGFLLRVCFALCQWGAWVKLFVPALRERECEDWQEKKMQAKSLAGMARISAGIIFTSAESHHQLSLVPNA
jgi:hypothetical protein